MVENKYKQWGWSEADREEVCRAILPHHICTWEVEKFYKECGFVFEGAKKFNWAAKIDKDSNAMGYLLSLCDTVCQAGRTAPELSRDNSGTLEIKYRDIDVSNNIQLKVDLHYTTIDEAKRLSDVWNKFYKKPLEFLGLEHEKDEVEQEKACIYLKIHGYCREDENSTDAINAVQCGYFNK
jgi:hypothetical protein